MAPQAGATSPAVLLGETTAAVWRRAAGHTYFFDRDARADLVAPTYDNLRRFLEPPHDTDQAVRRIEAARKKLRQP